jgi:peptidoglycan hydrolase CwlO-like protein
MKRNTNRLEEAVTTLLSTQVALQSNLASFQANQASFQANLLALQAEIREIEAERREIQRRNDEHFAEIIAILKHHEQMLQALPEAIREKIGFQRGEQP